MSTSNEARWRVLRTLWGALLAAQVMFVGVLWFLRYGPAAQPALADPAPELFPALAVVAAMMGIASVVLPAHLFRQQPAAREMTGVMSLNDEQERRLLPAAQMALVLGAALSESVSLLGFVLGFLGFPLVRVAPFFVAGVVLTLRWFPTRAWLQLLLPTKQAL